jgi:hypothetical protein
MNTQVQVAAGIAVPAAAQPNYAPIPVSVTVRYGFCSPIFDPANCR